MAHTLASLAAALELLGLGGKVDPENRPAAETLVGLRGVLRLLNGSPAREAALAAIDELLPEANPNGGGDPDAATE